MTAVVDAKHPVAILTTQLDVSLKQCGYIYVFEVSSLVVVIKNHVRTQKTCQCRVYAAAEWPQANFSIKCMTNNKYFLYICKYFL